MSVLSLLLALPVCWADRGIDPEVKSAQITRVSYAIEATTTDPAERAALVTIGWFESRFCLAVHAGTRRGGSGLGLWQIEPGSHRRGPLAGLDGAATAHAAAEALWLWRHSWTCGASLPGRFLGYAGLPCGSSWAGAADRARFMGWAAQRLRDLPDST